MFCTALPTLTRRVHLRMLQCFGQKIAFGDCDAEVALGDLLARWVGAKRVRRQPTVRRFDAVRGGDLVAETGDLLGVHAVLTGGLQRGQALPRVIKSCALQRRRPCMTESSSL